MGRAGAEIVAECFGENLRRVRRREGLSQEQLAVRASLHRTEVGKLERAGRVCRIDTLIRVGLTLPHGAEAAIRVWSAVDPEVYAVQAAVDQQRFDVMYESAFEILQNKRQSQMFAAWAVYLLVGYEQAALPRDAAALEWIAGQLTDALDSGRFTSVPDGE